MRESNRNFTGITCFTNTVLLSNILIKVAVPYPCCQPTCISLILCCPAEYCDGKMYQAVDPFRANLELNISGAAELTHPIS